MKCVDVSLIADTVVEVCHKICGQVVSLRLLEKKLDLPSILRQVFCVLDDVKLAELSYNSIERKSTTRCHKNRPDLFRGLMS